MLEYELAEQITGQSAEELEIDTEFSVAVESQGGVRRQAVKTYYDARRKEFVIVYKETPAIMTDGRMA